MIPDRVIGTSGSKVALTLCSHRFERGCSTCCRNERSRGCNSINTDENSPIIDESDIFIKGRLEDVYHTYRPNKKQIAISLRSN